MVRIRGNKIDALIKEGIEKLVAKHGKNYVYNCTELSKLINVSRPTLYNHSEFIDKLLDDIKAERKLERGSTALMFMRETIEALEQEKAALKTELNTLRKCHADIFEKLYHESKKITAAIKPILLTESMVGEKCILCDQTLTPEMIRQKTNVVDIKAKRSKKE